MTMSMESVEKIADVVLYEGYLLYPYRRSALKNQQRWTFGGVYPRHYSEESGGDDPWSMQTQCLVVGAASEATIEVKVRFLHVVDRRVAARTTDPAIEPSPADGAPPRGYRFVEELRVGGQVYQPWEEAMEREVVVGSMRLDDLIARGRSCAIDVPPGSAEEPLCDPAGAVAGALVRAWQTLRGTVEIAAEPLATDGAGVAPAGTGYRLTVRIVNTTPWTPPCGDSVERPRQTALRHTFVSTHTILRVQGGDFVSLLEPPPEYQEAAEGCANVKTWPVLVGDPAGDPARGAGQILLSSPIILYDYPQIAPETPGDLFETTEIDELLTLSILTLTDEEKREMRESDVRGREILERTEALTSEQLMKMHGAIRGLQPVRKEE